MSTFARRPALPGLYLSKTVLNGAREHLALSRAVILRVALERKSDRVVVDDARAAIEASRVLLGWD